MKSDRFLAGTLAIVLIAGFASPVFAQVTGIEANPPAGPISTNSLANPQHGNVDVSTLGLANSICNGIQFDGSNHQRYIPSANNIVSVDIELITLNLASVNPITVNLYQGLGIGGPLLGSTLNDDGNFAPVGQPAQVVHFDFAGPIALVPGNPYTIEIIPNDANSEFFWTVALSDPLPAPQDIECFNNIIVSDVDFIFATYFEDDREVGGEFLSIDSAALLLAGIQSSAIWILPVLAGAAGIGTYYIKTRMNKD